MNKISLEALRPLMAEMAAWADAGYPDEACGVVMEKDGELSVRCLENLQNRLHALDPERYSRDAKTAYNFNPLDLVRLEEEGFHLRVVFHSHPDRGAYFSDEDVLSALGGDPDGEPVLPGVDYLVLSAREDGVDDTKLFAWDKVSQTFEEQ